jgi:hypothetical protein
MSSNSNQKPVIFLAFANDPQKYLGELSQEEKSILVALEAAEKNGLCEVIMRPNATAGDIFDVFQRQESRDRIAVFHYGGHANAYQLLLDSAKGGVAPAAAKGLAAFLGQQRGLQLVFLNGCSTRNHTQELHDSNVSAVIATSQSIDDAVATTFAARFYTGLAGGASLERAYKEAQADGETTCGQTRNAYIQGQDRPPEDVWPWGLYLKKGAEIVRDWNLPDCVGDPLYGLPSLTRGDLPEKPFLGLHWFTRADAEVFFGRGYQIRELYNRVTGKDTAPILLVYGQSGVGKSSILDAGLLPRLERDYAVQYLRRDAHAGLFGTLNRAFLPEDLKGSVSRAWLAAEARLGKPLVIILDQVEEAYTRPREKQPGEKQPRELPEFLSALESIFSVPDARPQGKLILGFRKEWLPEIKQALKDHRLYLTETFLERLDRRGIMESITCVMRSDRLRSHYGLSVADGLAEIVADDLLDDPDSSIAPTLQILLTKMWDEASKRSNASPEFDESLYRTLKSKGILLRDFLDQQIAEVKKFNSEYVDSGFVLDMLAYYTTPLGTAAQHTLEDLQREYSHRIDALPALVEQFKALYLLADLSADNENEPTSSRLAHDTLAPLVRERLVKSMAPGQRARRLLEDRAVEWLHGQQGSPFDDLDLSRVEKGKSGMRVWREEEIRLVEASRRERENRGKGQEKSRVLRTVVIVCTSLGVGVLFGALLRSRFAKKEDGNHSADVAAR